MSFPFKNKLLAQAITLSVVLAGCSNLAPEYQQPEVALAEQWVGVALKEQSQTLAVDELPWRQFYRDPRLQKLIAAALIYNHDLRKAALNVQVAEKQYGITRSAELPTVGASGGFTRSRAAGSGYISEQYNVGLGISNFELDFFGRVKNQSQAALNQYLQTREARDVAQLSLMSAVAKTYFQWRIAEELRNLAQKTLNSRQKSYKLTKLRFQEGIASGTDLSTAQSLIAAARSSYQQQVRAVQQAENALVTLVGQPIDSLELPKGSDLNHQFPDKKLLVGLPSTVLLKRPDIRQAEYGLKAANANIGAARAAMFPQITLTGNIGFASTELSDLLKSANKMWSFGPSISMPIFDAGRRQANVKVSELKQKMAVETYQAAVQSAFQDVADALIARQTLNKQYAAERQGQAATAETLRLVRLQVQEGLADALNLLDAERGDFATRQGVFVTLQQILNNRVDLYTALGGGLSEKTDKVSEEKQVQ